MAQAGLDPLLPVRVFFNDWRSVAFMVPGPRQTGDILGAVGSAVASQLEGPGFDSRWGRCGRWGRVLSSASSVPIPWVGLAKGPFCVEFACSPRVP